MHKIQQQQRAASLLDLDSQELIYVGSVGILRRLVIALLSRKELVGRLDRHQSAVSSATQQALGALRVLHGPLLCCCCGPERVQHWGRVHLCYFVHRVHSIGGSFQSVRELVGLGTLAHTLQDRGQFSIQRCRSQPSTTEITHTRLHGRISQCRGIGGDKCCC